MIDNLRANARIVIPVAVVLVIGGAWLAFGFFGIQTLFIDDEVDEAAPVFDSGRTVDDDATDGGTDGPGVDGGSSTSAPAESPASTTAPTVATLYTGDFIDRSHPTSGIAVVLNDGTAQRFLRFDPFETDNGPDLDVYLSAAPPDAPADAFDDDFVGLGDLKGNVGSQNYEIPADVDLDRYRTVVIWCVRFGVAFGAAELQPA